MLNKANIFIKKNLFKKNVLNKKSNLFGNNLIQFLLDIVPGASVAYSLRKLSKNYLGAAIRVRRSSDNTEMNIGFYSSGYLNTTELLSFVGNNDGFITTWYDQSGNNINAIQTSSSAQPQIVSVGDTINYNNKPIIKFLDNVLYCAAQNMSNYVAILSSMTNDPLSLAGQIPFYNGNPATSGFGYLIYNNKRNFLYGGRAIKEDDVVSSELEIITNLWNASISKLYINSLEFNITDSATSYNTVNGNFCIGAGNTSLGDPLDGYIGDFILYNYQISDFNRQLIENYMQNYYF